MEYAGATNHRYAFFVGGLCILYGGDFSGHLFVWLEPRLASCTLTLAFGRSGGYFRGGVGYICRYSKCLDECADRLRT